MKVAIVGSNGFMGKHLNEFLESKAIECVCFSSKDGSGINPETGLFGDNFVIPKGTDVVYFLAQSPYYRRVPEMAWHLFNVNCSCAVKAAEVARKAKVKRFIYASTGSVYMPSFTPLKENAPLTRTNLYLLSKINAEEALLLFRQDMDITIVRPFCLYGPGQKEMLVCRIIEIVLNGADVHLQRNLNNNQDVDGIRISLCYIEDAIAILVKLLDDGNIPLLNIAGEKGISIREIANTAGQLLQRKPLYTITEEMRQGDLIADISLLKSKFSPQFTDFQAGMARTVESLSNNGQFSLA